MTDPQMNDELYKKLRRRVEYRLAKSPRYATINALLFSIFGIIAGVFTYFTTFDSMWGRWINEFSILAILAAVGWAGLTLLYSGSLFFQSGAWTRRRENLIQTEILDAMKSYDLDEDDWIELHLALSKDIDERSRPFRRLVYHAGINAVTWIGGLGGLWSLWFFFGSPDFDYSMLYIILLPVITFATIFLLPVRQIFQKPEQNVEHLRALYSGKPKRAQAEADVDYSRLVQTGDDGELIFEDEADMNSDALENPTLGRAKRKIT
jgi:hypothetical protein